MDTTPSIVLMSAYFDEMKVEHVIGEEAILETLDDRVGVLSKVFVYSFLLAHKNIVFIDYLDNTNYIDSSATITLKGLTTEACLTATVEHIQDNDEWAIVGFYGDYRGCTYVITRISNLILTGEAVAYYRGIEIDNILKELC